MLTFLTGFTNEENDLGKLGESEWPDGWIAAHYGPPMVPDEPRLRGRKKRVEVKMKWSHEMAAAVRMKKWRSLNLRTE